MVFPPFDKGTLMETWGRLLIQAAEYERKTEKLCPDKDEQGLWFFPFPGAPNPFFGKKYMEASMESFGVFHKKLLDIFIQTFHESMGMANLVPVEKKEYERIRDEHEALLAENRKLKKRVRELESLLSQTRDDQEDVIAGFNELIRKQGEEFKTLYSAFHRFFEEEKKKT